MSDNVILLGAGASFSAGIPLLGNFMDRMVEMAITGKSPKGSLSDEHRKTLSEVLRIRDSLESYHARVALNQFNIEQILSVLSFEALCGNKAGKRDLAAFSKAISTTIELTCNVLHDGKFNSIQENGSPDYRRFWASLLSLFKSSPSAFPTIITFNYDLVLERSLFQLVIGHPPRIGPETGIPGFRLNFCNDLVPNPIFQAKHVTFGSYTVSPKSGSSLSPYSSSDLPAGYVDIRLLKLHGSLNFPATRVSGAWSPAVALESPKITPPVFNKTDKVFGTPTWKAALETLRTCKNLIICGYSLPTTDTYMHYFLKTALGPNRHLNRTYVFDPELFNGGKKGQDLRGRYDECFSEQFRERIEFQPRAAPKGKADGTFQHLVALLQNAPREILFGMAD